MCILKVLYTQWLTLFRIVHYKKNIVMYLIVQWIILLLNYMAFFVKSCSLVDIAYWPAYYMARPFVLLKRNTLLNVLFSPKNCNIFLSFSSHTLARVWYLKRIRQFVAGARNFPPVVWRTLNIHSKDNKEYIQTCSDVFWLETQSLTRIQHSEWPRGLEPSESSWTRFRQCSPSWHPMQHYFQESWNRHWHPGIKASGKKKEEENVREKKRF